MRGKTRNNAYTNNSNMIYDKLTNYKTYAGISADIREGLEFLFNISPDTENGVYEISPRVKAIVSEYNTKEVNENGFEAHRQYIDIQYLISGSEKICSLPLEYLKETKPYNEKDDAALYQATDVQPQEMVIGNNYFAIFFPQDGHMPQLCVEAPLAVKKVVVKILVY